MSDEFNYESGDFVVFPDDEHNVGIVVRQSSNKKADDSEDRFVEVLGPIPRVLLPADAVRPFDAPPVTDPTKVTDSTASDVTGLNKKRPAK